MKTPPAADDAPAATPPTAQAPAKAPAKAPARRARSYAMSAIALAGGIGLAAFGLATIENRAAAIAGPGEAPPLPVSAQAVTIQDHYAVEERFVGRFEAARSSDLAFERGGRLVSVAIDEGDPVAQGDTLAQLDTALLEARRAGLEAERARAEAELKLAERTMARQGDLSAKGFASEQRFDEAETQAVSLRAQIAAVDAQLLGLEIELEKSSLKAPFPGLVASRLADPGAMLAVGQPVARLLEAGRPQARIGVPPGRTSLLQVGETYPLEAGDRRFSGRLVALTPDIAAGTRTVGALFDVTDAGSDDLRFGDIVRLALPRRVEARGAWLPLTALQEGEQGLWTVFVLRAATEGADEIETASVASGGEAPATDGGAFVARREAVEVLHVSGGAAFVRGGLVDGDRVVSSGVNRLSQGQTVRLSDAPQADRVASD